jgi:regulatory protein
MRITRIAKQERRDRYNISVDGRFAAALSAGLLAESGLREGDELEPGQLDPLIERDEAGKVLNRALRFLSTRPHSEHELRTKLLRRRSSKSTPPDPGLVDDAFERLRELSYLDDAAFARQWVEERGGQRGGRLLRAELRRKGVTAEVIDAALESAGSADPVSAARALAVKRLARLSGTGRPRDVHDKLTRYLAGRGYDYNVIRQALAELETGTASLSD